MTWNDRAPWKIYRYLSRELLFSFAVCFGFFFIIFFVNQILLMAGDILSKSVPPFQVVLLIVFSLPPVIALSAPFATLMAVMMAVGRLNGDNELLALQAHGLALLKIYRPFFLWGLVFTLASFFVNDYLLPLGTIQFNRIYREVMFSNPELELSSFSVKPYQNTTLVTGRVANRLIEDLVIFDRTGDQKPRVIVAEGARMSESTSQAGVLTLTLDGVESLIPDARARQNFDQISARQLRYNFLLSDLTTSVQSVTAREMSSYDVYLEIEKKRELLAQRRRDRERVLQQLRFRAAQEYGSLLSGTQRSGDAQQAWPRLSPLISQLLEEDRRPVVDRSLVQWELEFYQKFSIPLSCVLFTLLGFPLGVFNRRSGRTVGFGISLLLSALYWALLLFARTTSQQSLEDPFVWMFMPNLVLLFTGLGLFLLKRRA